MINIAIFGLLLIIAVFVVILSFKIQRRPKNDALGLMQQQIESLRGQVNDSWQQFSSSMDSRLQEINKQLLSSQQTVGDRLDSAAQVFGQVQKDIGSLSKATERVFDVGKDISSLQEILKAPKIRGEIGELFLSNLLEQVLPPTHIKLQHKFKNGNTVDAAICLGQDLVSIDSKFPLENFKRIMSAENNDEKRQARKTFLNDVKKHVDSIAEKYILPDEGTFDFALMYIPAENVYYELIIKENPDTKQALSSYAMEKKVIPVSPSSLYLYLRTIVQGLKGMRIEKNVQEIIKHLNRLTGDMKRFRDEFDVLGRHIVNIKNKYDEAEKRVSNFEGKLLSITQAGRENDLLEDDK
ncbi:MAG: DNA recombination protein RmuC [Candidatus Omnitrophica bacterium]|nr:DNA recombination protein RmuC [Candidatus Omnitrophota bacterium]